MSTLDDLKERWSVDRHATSGLAVDGATLEKMFKSRIKKHMKTSMQYFWASFALQIIVYALLTHVMIKYSSDGTTLVFSVGGILLFLPFTIMLMKKFKGMARLKLRHGTEGESSLHHYVARQHALLLSFYRFKKSYERVLIPLSTAIGVVLVFKLYVPGPLNQHWTGMLITFIITIISCAMAIRSENRKSFREPLGDLQSVMDEFSHEGK